MSTPEKSETYKTEFGTCSKCGKEYAVLIDGLCGECHLAM
jgi:NMD protein affecting ribosome stability and mRNA decay